MERFRTPNEWCRVCGGREWHRTTQPDTGGARLTCVGCGHVRKWTRVVFVRLDPDEALPGQVVLV